MSNVIHLSFEGRPVHLTDDGWLNATKSAKQFGKEPTAWLRQVDTLEYLYCLGEALGVNSVSLTELNEIKELDASRSWVRSKILGLTKRTDLVMTACPFQLPALCACEFLNRADTTAAQARCNNAQVSGDRTVQFPHAESFASRPSISLNTIKRNQRAESGLFIQSQGKAQKWGSTCPLLQIRNSPLLRPSINGYRPYLHVFSAKGRPSPGAGQRLPMVGFCLPNEKEHGMSHHEPSQFLLSG